MDDPPMSPPPPGTHMQWISNYLDDVEEYERRIKALIDEDNEKCRVCPLYAAQPHLKVLLPEYDKKTQAHQPLSMR
eukprot:14833096-Ditylum_brightwellii.AAC.1